MTKAGDAKRSLALEGAINLASVEGLTGLSFGHLAGQARVSKSTLQTLFGTKEELQLAILNRATEVFTAMVLRPAETAPLGLPRLRALMTNWLGYLGTFEGGCVFTSAACELDGRPGPVREALARALRAYDTIMAENIELAVRLGELPADTLTEQLTFELRAIVTQTNYEVQMMRSPNAMAYAQCAVDRLLPQLPEHEPRTTRSPEESSRPPGRRTAQ